MNTMITLFAKKLEFEATKQIHSKNGSTIAVLNITAKGQDGHETKTSIHLEESVLDAIVQAHQIKVTTL